MATSSSAVNALVLDALLRTAPNEECKRYFSWAREAKGLRVSDCGDHRGKGLFAERAFEEGEPVLIEPALVAIQACELCIEKGINLGSDGCADRLQHTANKAHAQVCSHCFRYVGSIESQIALRLRHLARKLSEPKPEKADQEEEEEEEEEEVDEHAATRGPLPSEELLGSLLEGRVSLPHSDRFPLPAAVACKGGCTEVFCCDACAQACWDAHHCLLCTGPSGSSSAIAKFKAHADATNDVFHVVAQVVAATVLRTGLLPGNSQATESCKQQMYPEPQEPQPESANGAGEVDTRLNENDRALLQAWEPFRMGWKGLWWETVARPEDVPVEEEAEFRKQLQDLATESLNLLAEAMPDAVARFPTLFSLEVYGSIVGMFELNNLSLVVDPPVENYFLYIDDLPAVEKTAAQALTRPLLDALDKDYDVACDGTAFYPLQACANHSCVPNCHAMKRETDINGDLVLLALRPISAGEELTISYVDETMRYADRRAALKDYGFVCSCPRCRVDEAKRAKKKKAGKK